VGRSRSAPAFSLHEAQHLQSTHSHLPFVLHALQQLQSVQSHCFTAAPAGALGLPVAVALALAAASFTLHEAQHLQSTHSHLPSVLHALQHLQSGQSHLVAAFLAQQGAAAAATLTLHEAQHLQSTHSHLPSVLHALQHLQSGQSHLVAAFLAQQEPAEFGVAHSFWTLAGLVPVLLQHESVLPLSLFLSAPLEVSTLTPAPRVRVSRRSPAQPVMITIAVNSAEAPNSLTRGFAFRIVEFLRKERCEVRLPPPPRREFP